MRKSIPSMTAGRGRRFAFAAMFFAAAMLIAVNEPRMPFVSDASAQDDAIVVRIFERNGSDVSAQATLSASDLDTKVVVSIIAGDGSYLPYLHRGTCFAFNESVSVPLSLVTTGNPSETTVDLNLENLSAGDIVIDLHVAEGTLESLMDPATSVACGTISAAETSSDREVVQGPVAGIGPFDLEEPWSGTTILVLLCAGMAAALGGVKIGRAPRPVEPAVIDVVAMHRLRGLFL